MESWPVIRPLWGILVLAVGLGVVLWLLYRAQHQERIAAARVSPQARSWREIFSRVEMRRAAAKPVRKQVRDMLGPLLGRTATFVKAGIFIEEAMHRVAQGLPPNALTEAVTEAFTESRTGKSFFTELYNRAVTTGYDPFVYAVVTLQTVADFEGNLGQVLRELGTDADEERLQELKVAAQSIQMKMSALAVMCLLPAVWLVVIMPNMFQALRMFTQVP